MRHEALFVFYDGSCGMCAASLAWALRRDTLGLLRPVPVPSDEASRLLGDHVVHALDALHAWSDGDGLQMGPDAVAAMLRRIPRWSVVGALLGSRVVRPLARPAYRLIARHRQAFSAACPLPERAPRV